MISRTRCARSVASTCYVLATVAIVTLADCSSGGTSGQPSSVGTTTQHVDGEVGFATLYIPGLGPQRVPYVVENGLPVAGDLGLTWPQVLGTEVAAVAGVPTGAVSAPVAFAAARSDQSHLWSGGVIPYDFDRTSIPVGSSLEGVINAAMADWQGSTPIRFVAYGGSGDYLHFLATRASGSGGLSSSVGRMPGTGQHWINFAPDVDCCPDISKHEIGHLIGLYHEHQRADRDLYVKAYTGESLPDHFTACGLNPADYMKYSNVSSGNYGNDGQDIFDFDWNSIMLYGGDTNACCSGQPCMTDLSGNAFSHGTGISSVDFAGVERLYYPLTFESWSGMTASVVLVL